MTSHWAVEMALTLVSVEARGGLVDLHVRRDADDGHRLDGDGGDVAVANRFLDHLTARNFSPVTRRAYAYDLLNLLRFLGERTLALAQVAPADLFDYLDWQGRPTVLRPGSTVVRLADRRGAAPATMNRRIAAVRGLFEYTVTTGMRLDSPVPSPRRSSGLRSRRGMLGHVPARNRGGGGRLVRESRRLPESLPATEVEAFLADLGTHRDRAMTLAMLLGGLRAGEVRGLLLADVDMGLRRVRVLGKGGRERLVPVDRAFFTELGNYLRTERPPGCRTPECFVVFAARPRGRG